jgi:hypothetical protein
MGLTSELKIEEEEFVIYYVTVCCHFFIQFVNRIAY